MVLRATDPQILTAAALLLATLVVWWWHVDAWHVAVVISIIAWHVDAACDAPHHTTDTNGQHQDVVENLAFAPDLSVTDSVFGRIPTRSCTGVWVVWMGG